MSEPYTPKEVMALLGIKRTFYYSLTKVDEFSGRRLLEYSRLKPGSRMRCHTQAQLDAYLAYLNGDGAVSNITERGQHMSLVRERKELTS
jgi:hypothetical protein